MRQPAHSPDPDPERPFVGRAAELDLLPLACRQRISDLREALVEAEATNDIGRAGVVRAELDALGRQLATAVGLMGRSRRLGSRAERARVSVTRAIHLVIRRIRQHDPVLARYLATTVKTGTCCSFTPDPRFPLTWDF